MTGEFGSEILRASSIRKKFGGQVALNGVDLTLRTGQIHSLLGENGAGKSTLVKAMCGLIPADSGEIFLSGEKFSPRNPEEAARAGVGVVFQELLLIPDMTVMENIYFDRQPLTRMRTISKRRLRAKTDVLFEQIGLESISPNAVVRDLSLAAKQFVAVAKVLADDPTVIILDEATSALGPTEVDWLLDRAKLLAAAGKSVIFISHRLNEIREISDQISVLRNGENVGTWERNEIDEDGLVSAMLGRHLDQLYPPMQKSARTEEVLSVSNLEHGRRLRGLNLKLHAGEILGIGGLEGQGQLELFLSLYGVVKSKGTILVAGKECHLRSPRDALRAGIGLALVPEDRKAEGIFPTLTVSENMSLASLSALQRFFILQPAVEAAHVAPVIDELKIGNGHGDQIVGELSGGNQQKVVVGRFLLTKARVLLLYDLTRGVDVGTKAEIFRMLADLASEGYGILFYSSDLAELVNVAHRVIIMFEGDSSGEFEHGAREDDLVAAMVRRGSKKEATELAEGEGPNIEASPVLPTAGGATHV